jgi:rare lipoprotein A
VKAAIAAALLAAACGVRAEEGGEPPLVAPQAAQAQPVQQHGAASWYGLTFHGRRTASGERFDMKAFTAAHPWLPFGTRVEVRNPHNGRSVTVRINDRGPHVRGRIIDLSHAAAQALGLLHVGTKAVVLTVADDQQTGRP